MKLDNQEIKNNLLVSAKEELDYFSNKGKPERERCVVAEFLRVVGIPFQVSELKSPEQESKVDVEFREARFQIKELTTPGLEPNRFAKDGYNSIKNAETLERVTFPSVAHDIPPAGRIYDLVREMVEDLSSELKYVAHKSGLDLLIEVTRTRASLIDPVEISTHDFADFGWRSVSCVNSKQAVVLYASSYAPEFLRASAQQSIYVSG